MLKGVDFEYRQVVLFLRTTGFLQNHCPINTSSAVVKPVDWEWFLKHDQNHISYCLSFSWRQGG